MTPSCDHTQNATPPRSREVLHLAGDVDINTLPAIAEQLRDLPGSASEIIVHLGQVTYIDSQGIRLLFEFAKIRKELDTDLALVAPPDSFAASVLRIISFDAVATILDSLDS